MKRIGDNKKSKTKTIICKMCGVDFLGIGNGCNSKSCQKCKDAKRERIHPKVQFPKILYKNPSLDIKKKIFKFEKKKTTSTLKPEFCEVCRNKGKIVYDHDHQTGRFRGWLCSQCNVAIGFAGENPNILRKLANYLER